MQGLVMWPYYALRVNAFLNNMLCENVILEQFCTRALAVEACALNLTSIEIFLWYPAIQIVLHLVLLLFL